MANELTDLDLSEWSICIDPANEDCSIEIVKSKSGLAPVLKETDMSDHVDTNDGEHEVDADFQAYAEANGEKILSEFAELDEDDQALALVGMAYENDVQEAAIEDATDVIKSLTENTVPREKYEELKKSAAAAVTLIEKMKQDGKVADADAGPLSELRKSLTAGGAELTPEAEARISEVEKSLARQAQVEAIAKAKTYGFGKADEVADLETSIRKAFGDKKADAFVAIVKQAGELAKKSPLFKAIGEDAGNVDANDPIAKAKGAVAEIRKANPNLTQAQAEAKYWDENPDAYAEYRASQRAA